MACKEIRELLPLYQSGELTLSERAAVTGHLATCAFCQGELADLQVLVQRVQVGLKVGAMPPTSGSERLLIPDLAARVRRAAAEATPDGEETGQTQWLSAVEVRRPRKRRWGAWLASALAAAVLVGVVALGRPLMSAIAPGSAVHVAGGEQLQGLDAVFAQNSGLRWANEHHAIVPVQAEVEQDGVRLQVLGAVADGVQTAIIYKVTGWSQTSSGPKMPVAAISVLNNGLYNTWYDLPKRIGDAWVGVSYCEPLQSYPSNVTVRLADPNSPLEVKFPLQLQQALAAVHTPLPTRAEEHGVVVSGVGVTYTPAQVQVQFRVTGGVVPISSDLPRLNRTYLETEQGTVYPERSMLVNGTVSMLFPRPQGQATLVIPSLVADQPAQVRFSLQDGTAEVQGDRYKLTDSGISNDRLSFTLISSAPQRVAGFDAWRAVDASGTTYALTESEGSSWGTNVLIYSFHLAYPIKPVAIEAHEVNVWTKGPWRLPLPPPSSSTPN